MHLSGTRLFPCRLIRCGKAKSILFPSEVALQVAMIIRYCIKPTVLNELHYLSQFGLSYRKSYLIELANIAISSFWR